MLCDTTSAIVFVSMVVRTARTVIRVVRNLTRVAKHSLAFYYYEFLPKRQLITK